MKKAYKFLVLTDHRVHKAANPVYDLLPALMVHPQCASIHMGSRGNPANDSFFFLKEETILTVTEVKENFNFDASGRQFIDASFEKNLLDFDVVLMRLQRPISDGFMAFLKSEAPHLVFINDPTGIEKTSNKTYLLNFPDLCPPMRHCHSIEEILDFSEQFPIVLKPLEEYGGKGILKIESGRLWEGETAYDTEEYLLRMLPYIEEEGYLAMKFMKNVSMGDKRILVVGGEIMGAALRLPAERSWLCNVAQGGKAVPTKPTLEEEAMIRFLSKPLMKEGILIYGADTLVDDNGKRILSEINTLSVGGFADIEKQTGRPILSMTIQKIIQYADQNL